MRLDLSVTKKQKSFIDATESEVLFGGAAGGVKSLTSKPAERWEMLITQIITLLAAAVVGFILAKIGM